ncbi:MAG TPA: TcpE family conjugal transfer membrane protein [Streptosporangiaceae bacterium]|nr:TcpE family conjugal transfer membrane protein [Streptosporangiaceae bacterium]
MDLPTYTNIWRIEKRLYKLYDLRLPMPLPVGQIAVFTAIAVPYVIILTVLGLPFSHTSFWLYVLPPGVLAWLATRPVLESKRLPELIVSQVRYLGEPRTWCRLAPLAEKDEVLVVARVWRRGGDGPSELTAHRAIRPAGRRVLAVPQRAIAATARLAADPAPRATPSAPAWPASPARRPAAAASARPAAALTRPAIGAHARPVPLAQERPAAARAVARTAAYAQPPATQAQSAARAQAVAQAQPVTPAGPAVPAQAVAPAAAAGLLLPRPGAESRPAAAVPASTRPAATSRPATASGPHAASVPAARPPADVPPAARPPAARQPADGPPAARPPAGVPVDVPPAARPPADLPPAARPPLVTVTGDRPDGRPLRVVERALRGPADKRGDGWHDRVVVVPGGHRPGRPDFQQRDRARAQLPVSGCRRIVVLGCTVGAGQTMTTLMTGEVLASVRDEPVAVLDLNPGRGSLAERADSMPAVAAGAAPAGPDHLHHQAVPSRLAVISSDASGAGGTPDDAARDVAKVFELLSARYCLTLADPGASAVPRVLAIADQLVLVAPASQDAARAIAMTLEWLEAHGHAELAASSATVINGVSRATMTHVEQAEGVARGRCRAIVRVPWDDQLRKPEPERRSGGDPVAPLARPGGRLLGPAAVQAYTALAGVLVAGLAASAELQRAQL